ncbi:DUF2007 domain-containing protein [Candidatus Sumerlaeota bacterium]|nr:DUF2007 domain-containing protein [Candidatus Sumerlaeota bacterium]
MTGPLKTVFTTGLEWEAQLLKGLLRDAGIPSHIQQETIGTLYGLANSSLGMIRLQVSAENADDAEALIEGYICHAAEDQGAD